MQAIDQPIKHLAAARRQESGFAPKETIGCAKHGKVMQDMRERQANLPGIFSDLGTDPESRTAATKRARSIVRGAEGDASFLSDGAVLNAGRGQNRSKFTWQFRPELEYRAKDIELNPAVAIRILPENVAKDRERLAPVEREAKVLASLNHPNIAAID